MAIEPERPNLDESARPCPDRICGYRGACDDRLGSVDRLGNIDGLGRVDGQRPEYPYDDGLLARPHHKQYGGSRVTPAPSVYHLKLSRNMASLSSAGLVRVAVQEFSNGLSLTHHVGAIVKPERLFQEFPRPMANSGL